PAGGIWSGSSSTQSFNQVVGSTKSISDPTRAGYTFTGWSKSLGSGAGLSGTTFTFGAANTSSTLTAEWSKDISSVVINPAGGIFEGSMNSTTSSAAVGDVRLISDPVGQRA
ncbi:MAG: hypothetical protein RR689_05440, partial [Mucinivorans sp.]